MLSQIKTTTRLSLVTGILAVLTLWAASGLGILPDVNEDLAKRRIALTESLAVSMIPMVETLDARRIEGFLNEINARNPDILSLGLRGANGKLTAVAGNHRQRWTIADGTPSTADQMHLDLSVRGKPIGRLEVAYIPRLAVSWWRRLMLFPNNLLMFCGATFTLLAWGYLGRLLTYLNPAKAVPTRVKSAFDSLSEGLVLINTDGKILLSNHAFAKIVNSSPENLVGTDPADWPWRRERLDEPLPWQVALEHSTTSKQLLSLVDQSNKPRRYNVSATPIMGDSQDTRGVMISFDDVTLLEEKKEEMLDMLQALRTSQQRIEEQNRELQVLASCDPLSSCLNRRAFFEWIGELWSDADRQNLHVIMVDIDHFKLINDQYGHGVGDEVIKFFGNYLRRAVTNKGQVCRYGGEEFCLAVIDCDFDEACRLADTICREIRRYPVKDCRFTASLGVSSRPFGAENVDRLLEQADQCLYQAKRTGRNRVVRWDMRPSVEEEDYRPVTGCRQSSRNTKSSPPIDYSAVHALFISMGFHNREVAGHSARVANLCVAIGRNLMSRDQLYALEIAALLHDVGSLGSSSSTGDVSTLGSGRQHDSTSQQSEISQAIVRSVLASDEIASIIARHSEAQRKHSEGARPGEAASDSLSARILTVCDAFDCMVNGRGGQPPMSHDAAMAELRRNMPQQYDMVVVERLAAVLKTHPNLANTTPLSGLSERLLWMTGFSIERLSQAAEDKDFDEMTQLAEELCKSARSENASEVEGVAAKLHTALVETETEPTQVLDLVEDVLDVCRAARLSVALTATFAESSTELRSGDAAEMPVKTPSKRTPTQTLILDGLDLPST